MHILIFQDMHACYILMFYYKVLEKKWVWLYWTGCLELPIHGRYPTTAGCEDFCLLRFRPGPIRPSLDNLVKSTSVDFAILTPSLVRTPDRHRAVPRRDPVLKPFTNSSFPVTWITGVRHNPQLVTIASYLRDTHPPHLNTINCPTYSKKNYFWN